MRPLKHMRLDTGCPRFHLGADSYEILIHWVINIKHNPRGMNDHQKLLTISALGVMVLCLIFAPWEENSGGNGVHSITLGDSISPIFMPPHKMHNSSKMRLRTEVVWIEMAAIAVIYAGIFQVLKSDIKNKTTTKP